MRSSLVACAFSSHSPAAPAAPPRRAVEPASQQVPATANCHGPSAGRPVPALAEGRSATSSLYALADAACCARAPYVPPALGPYFTWLEERVQISQPPHSARSPPSGGGPTVSRPTATSSLLRPLREGALAGRPLDCARPQRGRPSRSRRTQPSQGNPVWAMEAKEQRRPLRQPAERSRGLQEMGPSLVFAVVALAPARRGPQHQDGNRSEELSSSIGEACRLVGSSSRLSDSLPSRPSLASSAQQTLQSDRDGVQVATAKRLIEGFLFVQQQALAPPDRTGRELVPTTASSATTAPAPSSFVTWLEM